MSTLSIPLSLFPCGVQGELYSPITIGTTQIKALMDTGSGALIAVQNIPNTKTYKKRAQVQVIDVPNIPLQLNCSLGCTNEKHNACFFSQDPGCELHFGTGDLRYQPVYESVSVGTLNIPAFYLALADTEENFPFPIPCIMGIAHYKYADDSPLGSLCSKSEHNVLINRNTVVFQIFQQLGGGNCLVDNQTIRLAMGDKDETLSFALPPPKAPYVPMVTSMLPFYAVYLTGFQVGAVKVPFPAGQKQVVILDSGTSSGGSLAPAVYDALGSALVRYTNGLSGMSINDAQVQGVNQNKLGLFPPIAFTFGSEGSEGGTFTHVLSPDTYLIPDTCGKPNLINIFSRGSDNLSILGNVCFKQLAITFELLHDRVYFESLQTPAPVIDPNYPSPAAAPSGKSLERAMAASLQQGESVALPAPKVRQGVPHAVIQKLAAAQQSAVLTTFGAELVNNQCCLYDPVSKTNKNVSNFGVANNADTSNTNNAWATPRNIVLLSLLALAFSGAVAAIIKFVLLKKKR